MLIGAVIGLVIALRGDSDSYSQNPISMFFALSPAEFFVVSISFFVGFLPHTIIHELGHLVGGKLSGYTFISFAVGKFVLVVRGGKLVRKKYSVSGIMGQCLMSPPDTDANYNFPFILYNLGGGLANFLLSIIFLLIAVPSHGYVALVFYSLAAAGFFLGATNIIPLKLGGIANDGKNILICSKSVDARRDFWVQLKFVGLLSSGTRLRDMPPEWFQDRGAPQDEIAGALSTFRCSYLLDCGKVSEAGEYAKRLLENPGRMMEVHKNELRCELLFTELVGDNNPSTIEAILTPELHTYIQASATHLPKQRLLYAYARLHLKDESKATEALANFQKTCGLTPHQGEIAGEQELIALVDKLADSMA